MGQQERAAPLVLVISPFALTGSYRTSLVEAAGGLPARAGAEERLTIACGRS